MNIDIRAAQIAQDYHATKNHHPYPPMTFHERIGWLGAKYGNDPWCGPDYLDAWWAGWIAYEATK